MYYCGRGFPEDQHKLAAASARRADRSHQVTLHKTLGAIVRDCLLATLSDPKPFDAEP